MKRRILALTAAILLLTTAVSAQISTKHARVEMLSSRKTAAPGSNLLLGVHFVLEKGWHIYWVNPGDSGQPPVFKWQLPAGFVAGEIEWPSPERLQSSPTVADYGYRDDVLLMVPVKIAPSVAPEKPAEINLDAKWLICREVCIPDHAQLHLTLPIASDAQSNPATAGLFAQGAKLLPAPLPKGWRVTAHALNDSFVLVVYGGRPLPRAEFFPLDEGQIENAAGQKITPSATGVRIMLKKSDLLVKPVSSLRGVLVIAGESAYRVGAPVTADKALK